MPIILLKIILGWFIWPGGFFLVAGIFESRCPPIVKNQSRAFMPGDFALAVMVLAARATEMRTDHILVSGVLTVVILSFFWIFRKGDIKNYKKRAAHSPTKITHDIVGYGVFPAIIAWNIPNLFSLPTKNRVAFIAALGFYLVCVAMDAKAGAVPPEIIELRHPEDWKPIWETIRRWREKGGDK
ncbi:MAG: hypothetical protein Q4A79_02190 [Candidatus Saccharibacteria bacterium]|nr:hypothetical protein [Candidatus Saccharibacteria bacterium]